jgi:hypothetical protein
VSRRSRLASTAATYASIGEPAGRWPSAVQNFVATNSFSRCPAMALPSARSELALA